MIDKEKKTKPSFESRIDVTNATFDINDVQSEPKYDKIIVKSRKKKFTVPKEVFYSDTKNKQS